MISLVYRQFNGRKFTLPSVTIPDEALSIQEILNRYAVGRDIPVLKGGMFDLDDTTFEEHLVDDDILNVTTEYELILAELHRLQELEKASQENAVPEEPSTPDVPSPIEGE